MSLVRLALFQRDRHGAGGRVAGHVGERLLGDAVQHHPLGRPELHRLELGGHLHPLAALHRGDELFEQLVQLDLGELVWAQLEQQGSHLRLSAAGELAQPLDAAVQLGVRVDLAEQAVGREGGGPERLVDGVVQFPRQALALLGGRQLGRLAGQAGVGDRRRRHVGDRLQPLGV